MSPRWLAVGIFAVIGAYWIGALTFSSFESSTPPLWKPHLILAVGSLCAGGLMAAHTPLRPWREPLVAGIVGILATFTLSRLARESFDPAPTFVLDTAVSGAATMIGAAIVRRFTHAASPNRAVILGLGVATLTGTAVSAVWIIEMLGLEHGSDAWLFAGAFAGQFAGGVLVQSVVPVFRPWTCGAGVGLYLLLEARATGSSVIPMMVVGLGLVLIGAAGAAVGWRLFQRREQAAVPTATLQR